MIPRICEKCNGAGRNEIFLPGHPVVAGIEMRAGPRGGGGGKRVRGGGGALEIPARSHGAASRFRGIAVSVTKGIEDQTGLTMSGILRATMPEAAAGALSGPSFALEVARGIPGAIVAAHAGRADRQENPGSVSSSDFPGLYQQRRAGGGVGRGDEERGGHRGRGGGRTGLRGQHQGGADHPGDGGNPAAGGGVRGQRGDLLGIERIGGFDRDLLFAAEPEPRFWGTGRAREKKWRTIVASTVAVAEGYPTARSAHHLAGRLGIQTPIVREVYAMLYEHKNVRQAVQSLMSRDMKQED